jgi:hypothetical protein
VACVDGGHPGVDACCDHGPEGDKTIEAGQSSAGGFGAGQEAGLRRSAGQPVQTARDTFVMRTHAQITCFFDGLDLVVPDVVQVDHWQPPKPKVTTSGGWVPSLYAAVGRKP